MEVAFSPAACYTAKKTCDKGAVCMMTWIWLGAVVVFGALEAATAGLDRKSVV